MWFTPQQSKAQKIGSATRRPSRLRLEIERLEDRRVPAFLTPGEYESDGAGVVGDFNNDGVLEARAGGDVGDFNGDGKLDIVGRVGNRVNKVGVRLGNGDGTFQKPKQFPLPKPNSVPQNVGSVAGVDLNDDGKLDIVAMGVTGSGWGAKGWINILLGDGTGVFRAASSHLLQSGLPGPLARGDFNGDGHIDVLTSSYFWGGASVELRLNIGNGHLQGPLPATTFSTGFKRPVVADFNGDDKLDFAVSNQVVLGNGDGAFQNPRILAGLAGGEPIAVADFNHDGNLDIATATYGIVRIDLGNGDGTFQVPATFAAGAEPTQLAAGDFNGDGWADLVVNNYDANGIYSLFALFNDQVW
jgi:hypothetical protein